MSDHATITGSAITLVRDLPGPIERVWKYLTEPELLARWFSEGACADRLGGDVAFEIGAHGRVTEFEPPRLLEYTWNEPESSSGPVVDALVRWELAEVGNRVRLTLTHSRLPEVELGPHAAGWHTFLEALDACLEGRDPVSVEARFAQLKTEYAELVRSAGIRAEKEMNDVD